MFLSHHPIVLTTLLQPNVAGVFIVTLSGCIVACFVAVTEFFYGTKQQSEELGTPWMMEIIEELKFAFQCHGSTKVKLDYGVKQPFSLICSNCQFVHLWAH